MGNQICSSNSLNYEVQLKQSNIKIKCNSSKIKRAEFQPLIYGYVKVYQLNAKQSLIYQGQMKDSLSHGYGKLYSQNSLIYEGEFKNGLYDGWGTTVNYTGQFRQGKYDGYGVKLQYVTNDPSYVSNYYEGYFFNGKYNGLGIIIKNARIPINFISEIQSKQSMIDYLYDSIEHDMQMIQKYGTNQFYIGEFYQGLYHGTGRLFKHKVQHSGNFTAGNFNGNSFPIQPNQDDKKTKLKKSNKSFITSRLCFRDKESVAKY